MSLAPDAGRTGGGLDRAAVDALRPQLRGPALLPGEPAYDDARSVWNAMIDRRPALVVRCLGTADVLRGVAFAREQGLPLAVKGGGHNIAGLAVCDGGVVLDMALMRGVHVDSTARTAWVQAGCLLGDVDRETQLHGLAATLGFVSNTGVAGLTLGGGFGYLTRRFGWTSDTLLSADVVTADGRLVRASERENADLFWGLRGGGGNFGVVTGFEYRLEPVGPEIVAGVVAWPGEEAGEVLALHRRIVAEAPPEFVCVAMLRRAPPAPWLPPAIHGKPIVGLVVCHTGPIDEATRAAAVIKSFRSPVGDILVRRPYVAQQSLLDATQPKGRRYYWKSEYLPGTSEALAELLVAHAAKIPSPHSAIIVFPLDGALERLPADHSAVGNRDARFVVNITGAWERAEDDAANVEWARAAWRDLRPLGTGGTYVNFQTEDEGDERVRSAYGANYERLAALKARWDPQNLFRCNKNVPPRA
jgi:FAD/FMN-containing dehydrogenase